MASHSVRRGVVVGLLCVGVLLVGVVKPALAASTAASGDNAAQLRDQVTSALVAAGYSEEQAKSVTAQLNQDDLKVLAANPAMVQDAGDTAGGLALGILLCVIGLVVVGLVLMS